jgi:ankyrin repeat protein
MNQVTSDSFSTAESELDAAKYPVHAAALASDDKVLSELLIAGADPNALCPNGLTALIYAVHGQSKACIDVLFAASANPNTTDSSGTSPAHWATSQSDHKTLK